MRLVRQHFTLLLALGCIASAVPPGMAADAVTLRISQAVQLQSPATVVRVYLDALDRNNRSSFDILASGLSATLGEATLESVGTRRLADTSEGVAYIFLVDTSRSLSRAEFDHILDALDSWLARLSKRDRVAVMSFGDKSRLLVDFTNDFTSVQAALYTLGPTDGLTVLHQALDDALALARRRDADLPGRRVMVVLTDGRDEGSGLSAEDILDSLRSDPVPIYAIGFSSLRDQALRDRYLDLLHRFASNSGGDYVKGQSDDLGDAYAALHEAVRRVWVADFACKTCPVDGSSRRLQVNLAEGNRILSDGREFRLLPTLRPTPTQRATQSTEADQPADSADAAPLASAAAADPGGEGAAKPALPETEGRSWRWLVWLGLFVAVVSATLLALRRRLLEGTRSPAAGSPAFELKPGVATTRPPRPVSLRLVRLIVVRGNNRGREYNLTLMENGVVGTRSTCDCVIVDEPGVEPEQFELYQFDRKVFIRDLAKNSPTLVDGLTIGEHHLLKNQASVGTSSFIVRVVYDDPRPVTF